MTADAASDLAASDLYAQQWADICQRIIPLRYRDAVTDRPQIEAWVAGLIRDLHHSPSLLILGPTGTGKTHLAYAALRAFGAAVVDHGFLPPDVDALTAADLYASLRPRPGRDHDPEQVLRKLFEKPLLLIDDIGAVKGSEWAEEITYRLLNHRYVECLPSIFTTNLPLADLRNAVGDRIASRLSETALRIVLEGEDRRRA